MEILSYRLLKMDQRAWMYGIRRHSPTFMSEVAKFVEAAKKHARICKTKQIHCPCFDCSNKIVWEDTNVIKRHLIKRGFVDGYKIWSHHGEAGGTSNNTDISIGCDEVGGGDANDNDQVMMDETQHSPLLPTSHIHTVLCCLLERLEIL